MAGQRGGKRGSAFLFLFVVVFRFVSQVKKGHRLWKKWSDREKHKGLKVRGISLSLSLTTVDGVRRKFFFPDGPARFGKSDARR